MKTLSPLQQKYHDICIKYHGKFGKYPTLEELAEEFGVSQGAVYQNLDRIRRKGYL